MRDVTLAARLARRALAGGDARLLVVAVALAFAVLTGVGLLAARAGTALEARAAELLGADLVVETAAEPPADWAALAAAEGLRTAVAVSFPSVALAGERTVLVGVKGVDPGHPLRGALRTTLDPATPDQPAAGIPAAGQVWVDARVLHELELAVGDTLELGYNRYRIERVLTVEPDRGGRVFQLAPRVLVARAGLAESGLLGPGSRIEYRWLSAGPRQAVARVAAVLRPQLPPGARMLDLDNASPELDSALNRARGVFTLAALVAALLAAAAIAISARQYAEQRVREAALVMCLGESRARSIGLVAWQLAWIALPGALLGTLAGWAVQAFIAGQVQALIPVELARPAFWQIAGAWFAAAALVAAGAIGPLAVVGRVAARDALRRTSAGWRFGDGVAALLALLIVAVLLAVQSGTDWNLASTVFLALIGALLVLGLVTVVALRMVARFGRRARGFALRQGLAAARRRPLATAIQAAALAIGLTAILLLAFVRQSLVDGWLASLPADAPNRFLINVQAAEVAPLRDWLDARGLGNVLFYPTASARYVALNDTPVRAEDYEDARAKRLATRQFILGFSDTLPNDNRVVAGEWVDGSTDSGSISVDRGLAQTLGLKLHDRMRFRIGERTLEARIDSLRYVEWGNFRPNFFVLFPRAAGNDLALRYLAGFHLPVERAAVLADLLRAFPAVTVIDVAALLNQARGLFDQITAALQVVFGLALAGGVLVIIAVTRYGLRARRHEAAIARALGASRRELRAAAAWEFLLLGLAAAIAAAAVASLAHWWIATRVLEIAYVFDSALWSAAVLLAWIASALAGVFALRGVASRPPRLLLRGH